MTAFRFQQAFAWRLLSVVVLLILGAIMLAGRLGLYAISSEVGPLETGQLVFLSAAAILFALCAILDHGAGRMAAVVAAVGGLVLGLRELELPVTGPLTAYLDSDGFRIHEALLFGLPLLAYALARPDHVRALVRFALAFKAWPLLPILALLAVGSVFDGRYLLDGIAYLPTFLEETGELAAYGIYLLMGIQVLVNLLCEPVSVGRFADAA